MVHRLSSLPHALVFTLATACSGGGGATLDPAAMDGAWSGDWENTTFSSTGAASLTLDVDTEAATVDASLDLDGNVFGGLDPDPLEFDGTYDEGGMEITATTVLFGDFTLTISADGDVSGGGTPEASTSVWGLSFDGTATESSIDLDYTILDEADATYAEGTITFTKD